LISDLPYHGTTECLDLTYRENSGAAPRDGDVEMPVQDAPWWMFWKFWD
jgi:hypothetical protein